MLREHGLIIVFITAPNEEAAQISQKLLDDKLVACVNVIPNITSHYTWEGHRESSTEALLICKTRRALWQELELRVREIHSYDTPEVIALNAEDVSEKYCQWVLAQTL